MAGKDLTNAPLASLRAADLDPQDRIAPNFLVYELSVSELADRRGIDNRIADDEALRSAVHLARHVLQPIRDAFGGFTPNSVYRSQALERQLKDKPASWISTSQHTEGRACDVEIVARPTLELAQWASTNLADFDQIICECYDPRKGPNSGWVHISLLPPGRGRNRRQVLSYVVDPGSGRLVYVNGLQQAVA
jgi:Peptidase M15